MKRLAIAAMFLACLSASALNVTFTFTNSSTMAPDTNDFKIIPLGNIRNADGSFNNPGLPIRVHNPSGCATNYLVTQYYQVTNQFIGQNFLIRVYDSSSNYVASGDPSIYCGGANPFVELVIPNPNALTNAAAFDTNGAGLAAALLMSNNIAASGTAANALYANSAGSAALATTATTATAVTGAQSNLIATALQSVPATYALKTDATNAAQSVVAPYTNQVTPTSVAGAGAITNLLGTTNNAPYVSGGNGYVPTNLPASGGVTTNNVIAIVNSGQTAAVTNTQTGVALYELSIANKFISNQALRVVVLTNQVADAIDVYGTNHTFLITAGGDVGGTGTIPGSNLKGTLTNNTTGNAGGATNDSAGNNIAATYLPSATAATTYAPSTVTNLTSTQVGLIATSIQPGQTNSIISTATNLAAANAAQYANQVTGATIVAAGAVTNVSLSTNSSGVNGTVVTTGGQTTLTLTNLPASGGGVTNAFYTNTTTVVVSGSNLAIGTNNFGGSGGVSLSSYYAPTTSSNNIFLVQGSGTIFDDYYTNAGQAITNLVVQQQAGQYLYFKGVNNGMYLVSTNGGLGTFGYWRLGATIPSGNNPTLVALENSGGGSVGDPTKFTAVQYGASGTLVPAYQTGITISYATNANVLKTNIDVVVTSGLPLNSNNVSQVNLLASNQVVQLAGSSAMASFNGATPPSFDARLLTSQHFNGFEQWAALTEPPIIYDVSTYSTNPGVMQAGVLTCLTNLLNTGVLANLLSNNIPVIIAQQINWGAARTSTNGTFTGANGYPATLSNMAWNTNCFPNGIPWVASTLASNGVSFWLGAEVITNVVPVGASGYVVDVTTGSHLAAYTNGVNGGFNTASSGWLTHESGMTPATVLQDLSQLHSWGVSGVMGFNETATEQVASMTSLGCMSYAFNYSGFNYLLNYRSGWNAPMANIYQFSVNSVQGNLLGNGVRRFCNIQMTDNSSTPANAARLRKMLIEFPGCPSANQGAFLYTEYGGDANTNRMACKAILSCGVTPNSANFAGTLVTNLLWQTVSYDSLLSLPTLANDYTTNVGSAWLKPMSNNRFACYLENEGTNSTNIVLTLPPLPTYSTGWNMTNVWGAASLGTFTGSFTATNLPVGGTFFGILTPVAGLPASLTGTTPALISSFTNSIFITNTVGQVYRVPVY